MNGHKICWYCSKRIAWSNTLGVCRDCVAQRKAMDKALSDTLKNEKPCQHCGGRMVDGMCDAPLSVAD